MSGGFFDDVENTNNAYPSMSKKVFDDGEKKKTKYFVPVNIAMLLEAQTGEDDQFHIDGEAITDVILVGRVFDKEQSATKISYMLNDNTGCLKVNFYTKEETSVPKYLEEFLYEEDCYVKIFGNIRVFKDNKSVVGAHLKKITDHDAITNHKLQVLVSQEYRRKGPLNNQDLTEQKKGDEMTEAELKDLIVEAAKKHAGDSNAISKDELFRKLGSKVTFPVFEKSLAKAVDNMELFEDESGNLTTV